MTIQFFIDSIVSVTASPFVGLCIYLEYYLNCIQNQVLEGMLGKISEFRFFSFIYFVGLFDLISYIIFVEFSVNIDSVVIFIFALTFLVLLGNIE